MIEIFKAIFLGIVEGITEWLPISSTGHIILVDEFLKLDATDAFKEMFEVVIQLGAIMAVVVLFWNKLWPFTSKKQGAGILNAKICGVKQASISLWLKVAVACIPTVIIALPFEDKIDELFFNSVTVAIALIVYGIAYIIIEAFHKDKTPKISTMHALSYKTALLIGCFQALSVIPGTSRSGSTILGALLIGVSRTVSAEFSFYLAIPTMFGASLLKILKFGFNFTSMEVLMLSAGTITAFLVSVLAIKFLLGFIKKNSFAAFGYYRIALGTLVLLYFQLAK